MALIAGSATIDAEGVATKSGMAEAIYDAFVQVSEDVGQSIPEGRAGAAGKRVAAAVANRLSAAMIAYLVANLEVVIGTDDDELQTLPADTEEDAPTKGPVTEKTLRAR